MTIISLFLTLIYIGYCIVNKGIPHSLSATYYDNGASFSIILFLATILLIPKTMLITPENFLFLGFIFLSSVLFVAFAPNFNSSILTDKVHTYSAILALISSQIWVEFINPIFLLNWILLIIYCIPYLLNKYKILDIPNIKFFAELIMLLNVYEILL